MFTFQDYSKVNFSKASGGGANPSPYNLAYRAMIAFDFPYVFGSFVGLKKLEILIDPPNSDAYTVIIDGEDIRRPEMVLYDAGTVFSFSTPGDTFNINYSGFFQIFRLPTI